MIEEEKLKSFIITLTGPSGCGKTTVMTKIMDLRNLLIKDGIHFEPCLLKKYVTRPMRRGEIKDQIEGKPLDIISVDSIPKDCDLKYQTYGDQYAIRLKDIRKLLEEGKCPVVVINDVRVVEELKREFPNQVLALFLFREIPKKESFDKEAKNRGDKSQKTDERFNKATSIYRTYIENIGVFNRVVLNVGNDNTPDYAQIQVENLIRNIICGNLNLSYKRNGTPKLFIIAGHAKSGKDEIIKAVDDMGKLQASIIRKYTSRRQDEDDGNEMICRLIPSTELLNEFEYEYNTEIDNLERAYKQKEEIAGDDIDSRTNAAEWLHTEQRSITKPTKRFWNLLKEKEEDIAKRLRTKIVEETNECHKLEYLGLYRKTVEELRELYCSEGYHNDSLDPNALSVNWSGQDFIKALINETSVENNVTPENVKKIDNLKDLISLYKKDGYHKKGADIDFPNREKAKIEKELFIQNPNYLDIVELINRHVNAKAIKDKPKRKNPEDKAFFLRDGETGYILYENNETKYGFEVYNVSNKDYILYSKLKKDNKHLVLVASLPEIFEWCRQYSRNNIVTVFAHSEISVEEYKKIATSDAAIRKLEQYDNEILKYSKNIDKFDHVTIFAEEKINERPGAREEELYDQIFRLFRYYNTK